MAVVGEVVVNSGVSVCACGCVCVWLCVRACVCVCVRVCVCARTHCLFLFYARLFCVLRGMCRFLQPYLLNVLSEHLRANPPPASSLVLLDFVPNLRVFSRSPLLRNAAKQLSIFERQVLYPFSYMRVRACMRVRAYACVRATQSGHVQVLLFGIHAILYFVGLPLPLLAIVCVLSVCFAIREHTCRHQRSPTQGSRKPSNA